MSTLETSGRKTLMYVVPKQLGLKAVLMVASLFYDFWVTGPISYTTDLRQLSRNMHNEAVIQEFGTWTC